MIRQREKYSFEIEGFAYFESSSSFSPRIIRFRVENNISDVGDRSQA